MRKRTIVTILLAISCSILGFDVFNSIISKDQEIKDIAIFEDQTIEKLIDIRKAQKAYFIVHREYTPDWDTLKKFVNEGSFPNIERTESIIPLSYGVDSIVVTIDTLGMISVKDSIFYNRKDLDIKSLEKVPGTGETFDLYTYNSLDDNLIEVSDPKPINPQRHTGGNLKPLKFGSRRETTTKGSWEK